MTTTTLPSLLKFEPAFLERIWGGQALARHFGFDLPAGKAIGEAWLVSDHPVHNSVVSDGPWAGKTLQHLMEAAPGALLGRVPRPTAHGRFPLLLKLLDAQDILSVQVHPDDDLARTLDEPDGGKTEMWHVLHAGTDSHLITGLSTKCTPEVFDRAVQSGDLEPHLVSIPVSAGDSIFVPAGMVHSVGKDILLAEIQQNSDLTYRIFDFNRVRADGSTRELHLEAAKQAIQFGWPPAETSQPVTLIPGEAQRRTIEAACPHFVAERIELGERYSRDTGGRSFHILLAIEGALRVTSHDETTTLQPGECVLVTGASNHFTLSGAGVVLDYFVADVERDLIIPVREASTAEVQAQPFQFSSIRDQ